MEVFFITLLKIFVLFIALAFARGSVQTFRDGHLDHAWQAWGTMLVGTFMGYGFLCKICEVQASDWLPQLLAVNVVQSCAFVWWHANSSLELRPVATPSESSAKK